jgi:hypothetical protein
MKNLGRWKKPFIFITVGEFLLFGVSTGLRAATYDLTYDYFSDVSDTICAVGIGTFFVVTGIRITIKIHQQRKDAISKQNALLLAKVRQNALLQ